MKKKQHIFQIILLTGALIHCFCIFYNNVRKVQDFETYSFELLDMDQNESDSEEKEEGLKVFDYETGKLRSLANNFMKSSDDKKIIFYCFEKVKSPFLSIPYSPPEDRI
jgi:hypothetical protein